ncbi:unnamed protein product [Effrenium voratum]|nr:unnamed protein product [Effrenium voratum]CAJ1423263.1 unnamed protein product [Effrenium voratum]
MWACCDLDAELMESLPEKRWCVVGGADKGILVRQGQELSSPEASARLARGALVRQVSLVGDRLSFAKLMGEGPDTGWVSIKIKDKILMELAPVLEPKAVPGREAKVFVAPPAKVEGRKPRALCLHGTAATEKVLRAQLMPLLKLAGDDIEFKQWAEPSGEDGGWRRYEGWEQALRFAQEAMNKLQPDVLLGFSQGSNLAHPLAAQAALGRGHPLHCVVHFCTTKPGWVAQTPELFEWQIPVPALLIAGKLDETATGSSEVASSYADPAVLSHSAL